MASWGQFNFLCFRFKISIDRSSQIPKQRMDTQQLRCFLEVARRQSFSQAAEHCFVTQPSLSMQIKSLEEELGVVLLDRSKKPVIPTEAGTVVLERARETLKAYNCIREAVAELKGETSGKLRPGVITTLATYLLHKFITAFVRAYPPAALEYLERLTPATE